MEYVLPLIMSYLCKAGFSVVAADKKQVRQKQNGNGGGAAQSEPEM